MDTALGADVAAAAAAASSSGLAVLAARRDEQQVGPCVSAGVGEAATAASLHPWGTARGAEAIQHMLLVAGHPG